MSDLDVAIYPDDSLTPARLLELQSEIMERTRHARVDLVDLRRAPPVLSYEVVTSGEVVFSRDADGQNRFGQIAFLRYFDTQHLRNVQNQYLWEHLAL